MESEQGLVPTHTARNPLQYPNNMQSTQKEGARAKTSNPRIRSTSKEDSPRYIIVTNNNKDCNLVTVDGNDYDTITQGHPSKRTIATKTSSANQTADDRPQKTRRSYAGTITGIRFFPEQQEHPSTSQESQSEKDPMSERKKEVPWTPKQFYDVKGNPDYHMNLDGVVLTSLSGHPFCAYCRIPSHSRRSCHIRIEDLARNIDRPFHPNRGIIKSNNERYRQNKFPNELPPAKHEIAGTSKI